MAILSWLLSIGSAGVFAFLTKTWATWMQLFGGAGVGLVMYKLTAKMFDKKSEPKKEMTEAEKKR